MRPIGLYVHWPFCLSKCPYCDFNSHVRASIDQERWKKALLKELESYADKLQGACLQSIFFGGGTPSLMEPSTVEALINKAQQIFSLAERMEITLEANPTSIEVKKFQEFKQAGVNRVSVGIQSLRPKDLAFLGRKHSVDEAKQALAIAAQTFDNFSFDLIYARPGQTIDDWGLELREALAYGSPHLSLYQLTIEPNTAFATQFARGEFQLPDEETSADLYTQTGKITEEFGLIPYEISNYAKPGFESRHNTLYWDYEDYIPIGPGAHGRLGMNPNHDVKFALKNYRAPETWLKHVEEKGSGLEENVRLSPNEMKVEALLMGLRLSKGMPEVRLQNLIGAGFNSALDMAKVRDYQEQGYLSLEKGVLKVTPEGRLYLNTLLREIIL